MKHRFFIFTVAALMTLPSFACNFCSSRPKPLSGGAGGLTQDPGSSNTASPSANGSPGTAQEAVRRGGSSFSYDLKNYKADGQKSSNEKWSSGDFFDNR